MIFFIIGQMNEKSFPQPSVYFVLARGKNTISEASRLQLKLGLYLRRDGQKEFRSLQVESYRGKGVAASSTKKQQVAAGRIFSFSMYD